MLRVVIDKNICFVEVLRNQVFLKEYSEINKKSPLKLKLRYNLKN